MIYNIILIINEENGLVTNDDVDLGWKQYVENQKNAKRQTHAKAILRFGLHLCS